MGSVINVEEKDFNKEVLESDKVTLVYFWAEWCGPCKIMGPAVERFAKEVADVKVVKIDADKNQKLVQKYQIMAIPNILVFKNGKVVNQTIGAASPQKLKDITKV